MADKGGSLGENLGLLIAPNTMGAIQDYRAKQLDIDAKKRQMGALADLIPGTADAEGIIRNPFQQITSQPLLRPASLDAAAAPAFPSGAPAQPGAGGSPMSPPVQAQPAFNAGALNILPQPPMMSAASTPMAPGRQTQLAAQAFPAAAAATLQARLLPAPIGKLEANQSFFGAPDPANGGRAPLLAQAPPAPSEDQRLLQWAVSAMQTLPDGPAKDAFKNLITQKTGGFEAARVDEEQRHNRATEATGEWTETKDAMGNPMIINKVTGEAKRPNGVAVDTSETVGPMAKLIANYDIPPLSNVALLKPFGQAVMAQVEKINPDYRGDEFASRKSAKVSFASGKNGTLVRQANTATSHIMTLDALGDALDNGDISLANSLKNEISKQFGGAAISGYDTAAKMVGDEVNKFIGGGPGSSADRTDYAVSLSSSKGPAARKAAINAIKGLMTGQLHSLQRQYETETKAKDFGDKLEPEVANLLSDPQFALGRNPTVPVAPPAGPQEGATATNKTTGQKLVLKGGQWVPLQ